MPERDTSQGQDTQQEEEKKANVVIQEELAHQEAEVDELINEELRLSGQDALDIVPQKDDSLPPNLDDYVGD